MLVTLGTPGALAQPEYTIVNLGVPAPDTAWVVPRGINNLGEVVGMSVHTSGVQYRAWKWTKAGGMVNLPVPLGVASCAAIDINDSGLIAVGGPSEFGGKGFRYENGVYTPIPFLAGATWGVITALNNQGDIFGYGDNFSPGSYTADWFLHQPGGSLTLIQTDPVGNIHRANDLGEVACRLNADAAVWSLAGGMVILGDPPDHTCTTARAINNAGVVVGHSSVKCGSAPGNYIAWRRSPAGQWETIADFTLNSKPEVALAINSAGEVVGYSEMPFDSAWHWSPTKGARMLETLVDPPPPLGVPLRRAVDINDAGQILVEASSGAMPYAAFLLTPIDNPPACEADCDQSGTLDIDDFICFQTLFALGDPGADCDADASLTIDDFICFQTLFAIGC